MSVVTYALPCPNWGLKYAPREAALGRDRGRPGGIMVWSGGGAGPGRREPWPGEVSPLVRRHVLVCARHSNFCFCFDARPEGGSGPYVPAATEAGITEWSGGGQAGAGAGRGRPGQAR